MLSWQMKNKLFGWDYIKFQWGGTEKVFRVHKRNERFWVKPLYLEYEVLPEGVLKGFPRNYENLTGLEFQTDSKQTICTKPLQVKAWIDNNKSLWEYWEVVVATDAHEMNGKTKLEAVALANYYEGRYDMACNFKMILEEK